MAGRKKRAAPRDLGRRLTSGTPASGSTWTIRFAGRVLEDDLDEVGHAAFDRAKQAINKKLKVNPKGYGENLHHPLHGFYKIKSSHIRIVYHVQAPDSEVWVLMIADRRDIWDREEQEILERYEQEVGKQVVRSGATKKKKPTSARRL